MYWPNYKCPAVEKTTVERKKVLALLTASRFTSNPACPIEYVVNRFSSYMTILRVLGNCLRFAEICRNKRVPYLTSQHLKKSEEIVIRWAQQTTFKKEIRQMQSNISINQNTTLRPLDPFIDEFGILRVGGRLRNSQLHYSTKHPAILPKQHDLTDKIVRYIHESYLHPNQSTMLFITRAKYWIIGTRGVVKRISNGCVHCNRSHPKLGEQMMGNLPAPRVTLKRPFTNVGVDYAGPMLMSSKKGRGSKRIKVALFVWFATKALHIEVVSDLSTDAFIAALKRFTGRRGLPDAIYSDNATNFVGARRRFDEFFTVIASKRHNEEVSAYLSTKQIEWHTIPPSAPHFGGLWEAGVKSLKTQLRRVL